MSEAAFKGWTRPGPTVPGGVELEPGETLDWLCGNSRIFQYEKGHRFSTDDLLTAWFGTLHCPRVDRAADLGSGIGSVGMVVAWRCPGAVVHTVEAQAISVRLARKSVRYNGLDNRYTIHEGDLRDAAIHAAMLQDGPFDLVTGTPPYWPLGARKEADHAQAIPARLEVRGTIADYAVAAAKLLAPGGLFACCFPNDQRERAFDAFREAGLALVHLREVIFKEGEPYGILLLAGPRAAELSPRFSSTLPFPGQDPPLLIRNADGSVHESIARARLSMGFPPGIGG